MLIDRATSYTVSHLKEIYKRYTMPNFLPIDLTVAYLRTNFARARTPGIFVREDPENSSTLTLLSLVVSKSRRMKAKKTEGLHGFSPIADEIGLSRRHTKNAAWTPGWEGKGKILVVGTGRSIGKARWMYKVRACAKYVPLCHRTLVIRQ